MTEIELNELTTGALDGDGVFDKMMISMRGHLESEFIKGRIKGPEYSTVYLGSLESVMASSMNFVMQRRSIALQADLLEQQILLAQVELLKANVALELLAIEKQKASAEVDAIIAQTAISTQQRLNLISEVTKTEAEILVSEQQRLNLAASVLQVQAQTALIGQQKLNMIAELTKIESEIAHTTAQTAVATQQVLNLTAEALNIPKQGAMLDKQVAVTTQQAINLASDNAGIVAKTANTVAEGLNIPKTGEVLDAQVCKLQAEYDLTVNTNIKTTSEIELVSQKTASERAQTQTTGVAADSVIGKQKALYQAQTDGFARDAEQKAAKLLVDTWSARRMSDEGTVADGVNMLNDATVGRAVTKVLAGINA